MAKRKIRVNLNQIEGFAYQLQENKDTVMERLNIVAEEWGALTEGRYASSTNYKESQPFHSVEDLTNKNALKVSVGNEKWYLKFVEAGTKAHEITHKTRNPEKSITVTVSGITGTKVLSKVMNSNRKLLVAEVQNEINNLFKG